MSAPALKGAVNEWAKVKDGRVGVLAQNTLEGVSSLYDRTSV